MTRVASWLKLRHNLHGFDLFEYKILMFEMYALLGRGCLYALVHQPVRHLENGYMEDNL